MKLFGRGDFDGFCAIALDNIVQLLLVLALCIGVLGFHPQIVFERILPGIAVSYIAGNLFYAWQAHRLAKREGRDDVCAQPFGLNTPSVIAYVFFVMAPAKQIAIAQGAADPDRVAWRIGLLACFASGIIEFAGAFIAERIRRATPRAALLASLAGAGLTFLSMNFFFSTFAHPIVGFATLGLVLIFFFGGMKPRGGIPAALFIVVVGTALAWATGLAPSGSWSAADLGWRPPLPAAAELWRALHAGGVLPYLSVIVPMGLLDLLASLQCIESAAAAGDSYSTPSSLAANGLCTFAAACFGSPFPTSIYIGHPAWKRMGARAGYSTANAVFLTVLCLTGAMSVVVWAVPPDTGLAIIIWIGFIITIQAFETTDRRHWPAVLVGMIPVILAWVTFAMKTAARIGAESVSSSLPFNPALVSRFHDAGFAIEGGFAIEQGTFCCALILSAITVFIVDRKFVTAALWSLAAGALSSMGVLHAWRFQPNDTVGTIPLLERMAGGAARGTPLIPAASFAIGYVCLAAILLLVRVFAEPDGRQRES
jgi:AGZA family xanthine/uracil permease-like MFS transporter